MSRTYKKKYTSSLFHNGEHGSHNTLLWEFREINGGGWLVKESRGLIDRRDYESDRNKGIRHIMNKMRRTAMKRKTNAIVKETLEDL
jgi:hypothetical protein